MNVDSSYDGMQKIFHAYIDVAYWFPEIHFSDTRLSQERMLHIIKRRREEGRTVDGIKRLFDVIPSAVDHPEFEIQNKNQRDYPDSVMRVRGNVIVVVNKQVDSTGEIITAFTRSASGVRSLKKKKLQESASGETPRSEERSSH